MFEPEFGQMVFGQPWKEHKCPEILDAAIESIRADVGRILWNAGFGEMDPFCNSSCAFRAPNFGVWAYDWTRDDDDPQPYNFARPDMDIYISWYKRMGRGVSVNREVSADEASELLKRCKYELYELEGDEFDEYERLKANCCIGSIGEVPYFEPKEPS